MSKYYAVKKGRQTGIYTSWPDCQQQITGYSGAVYKSFASKAQAQEWLTKEATPNSESATQSNILSTTKDDCQTLNIIQLYTDGGSRNHGNKRGQHVKSSDKAAWALLIIRNGQRYTATGGEFGATNNRMELMAFRNALGLMVKHGWNSDMITATLDSHYVLDPLVQGWVYGWQKRGWKTSSGSAVANQKLWEQVLQLLPRFDHLSFEWTKGHADNTGNVTVDHLLNETMDKMGEE